jgi:hypothetical protein
MDREDDTLRTGLMREAALYLARVWVQFIRPLAFDRVFILDGVRVRITIDEFKPDEKKGAQ